MRNVAVPAAQKVGAFVAAASNRGTMLDLGVFALNLWAMGVLSQAFAGIAQRAGADDPTAQAVMFTTASLLFVLAPIGAVLRRWHDRDLHKGEMPDGCLFSPVFYFCLTAVEFAAVIAYVLQTVYGRREPPAFVFIGSVLVGIVLMVAHTVLVFRYFSVPANPPRSAFLLGRASSVIGSACLLVNAVLFQLVWNLLAGMWDTPVGSLAEATGRLAMLVFLALLLYFPPRVFTLAVPGQSRWIVLSVLFANAPVVWRTMLGG